MPAGAKYVHHPGATRSDTAAVIGFQEGWKAALLKTSSPVFEAVDIVYFSLPVL